MYVLVLTAAQGVGEAAAVEAAALVGASGWRETLAGVFEIDADAPVDLSAFSAEHSVDANFVRRDMRRKKLLIADMDSTMIPVECVDELADFAGVRDEVEAITEIAMRGEMDFEEAIDARVALLEGQPVSVIEECYRERISLNPGARVLVRTMATHGAFTALVSGGFTAFTSRVAEAAGFHVNRANTLLDDGAKLTGTVARPILGCEAKRGFLNEFCAQNGITTQDAMAVGDGANDLAMIEAAGLGVAYKAKPILKQGADIRLDHSDLSALLAIQGYTAEQYVTD